MRKRKCSCLIQGNPPSIATWAGLDWEKKTEKWIDPLQGIDIAVAEGTEVAAVKSGVVTETRTSATLGRLVKFRTTDGYDVMYAHLSEILVKKGEEIRQGQAVARSGNTGLSTGPHLHYSVWKDGTLLDPLPFVTLRYTEEVRKEYEARDEVMAR